MNQQNEAQALRAYELAVRELVHAVGNQLTLPTAFRLATERGTEPGISLTEIGQNAVSNSEKVAAASWVVTQAHRELERVRKIRGSETPDQG